MNTPVIARAAVPVTPEFAQLVPLDKKLDPAWVDSLTRRGKPERFSGKDLQFIGMPIGGLFCGTVYLGGDGRLWLWDIFNESELGVFPKGGWYQGKFLDPISGAAYVSPGLADQHRVLKQGFTLSVETAAGKFTRTVDADRTTSFSEVTFTGEYPVGVVTYDDPVLPVNVKLQAFSPFIPLNADDSSLPATIFDFTVTHKGSEPAWVALTGFLENAVFRAHPEWITERRNEIGRMDGLTFLRCFAAVKPDEPFTRPDLPFEDWSQETYAAPGWKVEGDAFGNGPIFKKDLSAHQGEVGGDTERVINSFATAPGETISEKDAGTGKLTSRPFRIERTFINLWISGGKYPETVRINVVVDGKVVRSLTGNNSNRLRE